MSKFVNTITTVLGLLLIPYAAFLIYSLERFTAMDFLILTVAGIFLVWFKDSSARDFMEKVLNSRVGDRNSRDYDSGGYDRDRGRYGRGSNRNGNIYEENNNEN